MRILDRDEIEVCAEKGIIGEQDLTWIARLKRLIAEKRGEIFRAFESLLDA